MAQETPKRWAILIGADCVDENSRHYKGMKEPPLKLKGAVADATAMNEYLKAQSIKTILLVTGNPESLPTRQNFAEALKCVTNHGHSGDSVYIHYSGHGTRFTRDDNKDQSTLSRSRSGPQVLALCLYDRPLPGYILREHLLGLEKCKMHVTLVLDCCFSGSVMRNEVALRPSSIRFMEYVPPSDVDSIPEQPDPFLSDSNTDFRNADLEKDPLTRLDPQEHSILTACGPGQLAEEICIGGVTHRGALSYFLLDTLQLLQLRSSHISWQSLHQHLCTRFRAKYQAQTPMRYGKVDCSFFEELAVVDAPPFVSMCRTKDGQLELQAGQAHGVHSGDEYEVCRYDFPEDNIGQATTDGVSRDVQSVRVVVKKVECLTSTLAMASPSDIKQMENVSSWKARCVHSHVTHKVRIGITPSVLAKVDADVLAAAAQKHSYLDLAMSQRGDDVAPVLNIALAENDVYQIQDAAGRSIQDLPSLGENSSASESAESLAGMAGHIATFKYFEGLQNESPDNTFDKEFSFESNTKLSPDGCYEIIDNSQWGITFRNLGKSTKYISIFNFSSQWKVTNLVAQKKDNDSMPVPPKTEDDRGELPIQLRMTVPPDGRRVVEDVIKVIVTNRATVFPSMILPALGNDTFREDSNGLDRLLKTLGTGWRGEEGMNKTQWSCQNFIIRISMKAGETK